ENCTRIEDRGLRLDENHSAVCDPRSSILDPRCTKKVVGVLTKGDTLYRARAIVLTTGTFLRALMHMGEAKTRGGRAGDQSSESLSDSLTSCGFQLARFKTGT